MELDRNGKKKTGDIMFPVLAVIIALEILRRERPDDLMLSVYIEQELPNLEDSKYTRQLPNLKVKHKTIDEVDYKVSNGQPVDFNSAITAVATALLPVLHCVLRCTERHPLYMDCIGEDRLKILNGCIQFFDRRFSYQVWQMSQQSIECPMLYLGGTTKTEQYRFTAEETQLDTVSMDEAKTMNKNNWVAAGGIIV
ncbi:hypothetical protein ACEPPN_008962 [Leptodophora sp. 'Broadleaf-Isolate-01']